MDRLKAMTEFAESISGPVAREYAPNQFCHECLSCRAWANSQVENDHSIVEHQPNCRYLKAQAALGRDVTGFKVRSEF